MENFVVNIEHVSDHEVNRILPLSHNCESSYFEGILNTKVIEPVLCDVFEEKLSYFFWGKPSYFSPKKTQRPCFLLFAPEEPPKIKRIAPFDTGAFKDGLYDRSKMAYSKNYDIKHFCIEAENLEYNYNQKIVRRFFKNNKSYFNGNLCNEINEAKDLSESGVAVYEIYSNPHPDYDPKRATSIEIQVDENYDFKNHKLIYAIVYDKSIKRFKEKIKSIFGEEVPVDCYYQSDWNNLDALMGKIYEKVQNFLEDKKYFDV